MLPFQRRYLRPSSQKCRLRGMSQCRSISYKCQIGQICTLSKFTWNILICPPLSTQLSNYVDCHICQAYALVLGANRQVSTIKIIEKCDIPIPKNADEFYWTNWDTYPDHHWKLSRSFLLNPTKALITLYYNLYRAGQWASDVDHSYKTHK